MATVGSQLSYAGHADPSNHCDELTRRELATAWTIERVERWPDCTNPRLPVSRQAAVNELNPLVGGGRQEKFRAVALYPDRHNASSHDRPPAPGPPRGA